MDVRNAGCNAHDVFQERIVIALVGLPARGKSYLSHAIVRYMNFLGCPAKIFNAGNMRRKEGLAGTDASFFDASNKNAAEQRERMAMDCLEDLLEWIDRPGGGCSIGILDATNTTVARRKKIVARVEEETKIDPCIKLIFLESYVDDEDLLEHNYKMKLINDDYKGTDPEQAMADFQERVKKYEAVYQPVDEDLDGDDTKYIKIVNAGKKIISNGVEGFTLRRVQRLLGLVHLWPRTIWIALVGETFSDLNGVMGGDPALTEDGLAYTRALCNLIRTREEIEEQSAKESSSTNQNEPGVGRIVVYTGTSQRYVETANLMCNDREVVAKRRCQEEGGYIRPEVTASTIMRVSSLGKEFWIPEYQLLTMAAANDINSGSLDGLSETERHDLYPDEMAAWEADKLNYRFPGIGGESYQDVIVRAGELVCLLEQSRGNSLVICDHAMFRVISGYFLGKSIKEIPNLNVKSGVLELRRNDGGFCSTELSVDAGKATSRSHQAMLAAENGNG